MTIGIIVAMNKDRVIGVDGGIPWRYPGDLARFKRITMESTVIMGRKTWESIPAKFRPLRGRRNVILTSDKKSLVPSFVGMTTSPEAPVIVTNSIARALSPDVFSQNEIKFMQSTWIVGGARVYAEAMQYADVIDVTHVPDCDFYLKPEYGYNSIAVFFPPIDESIFLPGPIEPHPDEPALTIQRWTRR